MPTGGSRHFRLFYGRTYLPLADSSFLSSFSLSHSEPCKMFCLLCSVALSLCSSHGPQCLFFENVDYCSFSAPLWCVLVFPFAPTYFRDSFTFPSAPAAFPLLARATHSRTSFLESSLRNSLESLFFRFDAATLASSHVLIFS